MEHAAISEELQRFVLPLARFDGVALQARNPRDLAGFWHHNLPGTTADEGRGRLRLNPSHSRAAAEILRLIPTPAPAPDPSRVHFDIRLPGQSPTELLEAGASVIRHPGEDPWWVLADPEGNHFCAYPAVDDRPAGVFQLVVKCHDAPALAHWWADILSGQVTLEGESALMTGAPEFPWDYMLFDPVPEPRTGPNRMHWHVELRDPEPHILVKRGAKVLHTPFTAPPCDAHDGAWILADPEGNEFCALPGT
ncbi:VOC family protein [Actinoplanes sp. NPDC051494]|uniref:VOC family protein n=1 Tax=Actinoplanes sp. NPDC051494 TaxID=3363907 RepID=UPI00378A6490